MKNKFVFSIVFAIFIFCFIGGVSAVGTYPAVDPDMVLYYHFSNNATLGENSTYVVDYSSSSNNGTMNQTSITNESMIQDGSIIFNGVNSTLIVPNKENINIVNNSNYTICIFAKVLNGQETTGRIFSKFKDFGNFYELRIDTGSTPRRIIFEIQNDSVVQRKAFGIPSSTWLDGKEHMYCVITTTSYNKLYLDKNDFTSGEGTVEIGGLNITNPLYIGNRQTSASPSNISTDEFIMYNKELSYQELSSLYDSYFNKYYFYYNTSDGNNVSFKIIPRFDAYNNFSAEKRSLNLFSGIFANITTTTANYYFQPSIGGININMSGNLYNAQNTSNTILGGDINLYSADVIYNDSESLYVKYNFLDTFGNNSIIYINYSIKNYSLMIDINGDNKTERINLYRDSGGIVAEKQIKTWRVGGNMFLNHVNKGDIFYSIYNDFSKSNHNSVLFNSPSATSSTQTTYTYNLIYLPLLDGSLNNLSERFFISVSDKVDDTFPINVNWGIARNKNYYNNITTIALHQYNYYNHTTINGNITLWSSFGFRNINLFFWNSLSTPIASPSYIYSSNFNTFLDFLQSKYKFNSLVYSNYVDLYTTGFLYSTLITSQNSTGQEILNWEDSVKGWSRVPKSPYQYIFMLQNLGNISIVNINSMRLDVYGIFNPWKYIDFNNTLTGLEDSFNKSIGTLKYYLSWNNKTTNYVSQKNYTTLAEDNSMIYSGMFDYFEDGGSGSIRYIPNQYFNSIYPYSSTLSPRVLSVPTFDSERFDISNSIINRMSYMMFETDVYNWTNKQIVDGYYLTNYIQSEYSKYDYTSNITYYNDSSWLSLSDLIIQDDISLNKTKNPIVHVEYPNELNIYSNFNKSNINITYNLINYTLYPNKTIAWNNNTGFFEYFGKIGGINVSIVESNDYIYLDADGSFTWNLLFHSGDLYAQTTFDFANSNRNYNNITTLTSISVNNQTKVYYRLGNNYQIKYNASDILKQARLYDNNSNFMDVNVLGNSEEILNNSMNQIINSSILSVTNSLLHNSTSICNGSSADISSNTGNVNITLAPNEQCYVLDTFNVTLNSNRQNDPIFNGTSNLINNTLQETITFDIYGSTSISNGSFSDGTILTNSKLTIPNNNYGTIS